MRVKTGIYTPALREKPKQVPEAFGCLGRIRRQKWISCRQFVKEPAGRRNPDSSLSCKKDGKGHV